MTIMNKLSQDLSDSISLIEALSGEFHFGIISV